MLLLRGSIPYLFGVSEPKMHIRRISELDLADGSGASMNVCVVSSEFNGPVKNGGIGTATSALLKQLVADGHRVTLLYTLVEENEPVSGDRPWSYWVESLAAEKISLEYLPHDGGYYSWREKSWRVKEFLAASDFDVVYFNDHHGNSYYSLLAKRAGLAPFSQQLHCIITHGSMEWVFDINDQYARQAADLEMIGIERRSVELADVVIGPSSYLLHQYEKYGWRLPANTFQHPYPIYQSTETLNDTQHIPIDELVFFGRLEVRKGLWLFCEAVDRLSANLAGKTVTFMGRIMDTSGVSSGLQIVNRSSNWPCRVRLLSGYNQDEAIAYLSEPGRLAVMPSLADNSPCVIYECIDAGIPFVATLGSGGEELVDPGSWPDVMAEPTVDSLTSRLKEILERGAKIGQYRSRPRDIKATWTAWHRYLSKNRMKLMANAPSAIEANHPASRTAAKAPLMVIIDRGTCDLSLLIENLSSHIKRFAARASYLLLSSRNGELQNILPGLFNGASDISPVSLCVSNIDAIEEARDLIRASPYVFFLNAETEMLTPFFVLALGVLSQQPTGAAVSCAVATRRDTDKDPKIETLPSGNLPGLAALGGSIGSSVWAISTQGLEQELSSIQFYDEQAGSLASASALGQSFLYRCCTRDVPVQILPIVGAMETCENRDQPDAIATVKEAKRLASYLDVPSTVYSGGAAWFAISKFGMSISEGRRIAVENSRLLPEEHPLAVLEKNNEAPDLPDLAAAMGRSELALQLAASRDVPKDRVRHLLEQTMKAIRLKPSSDLAGLLSTQTIMEFGRTLVPEKFDSGRRSLVSKKNTKSIPSSANKDSKEPAAEEGSRGYQRAHIYIDAQRLRLRQNRLQATPDLVKESGKLLFIDVALCGNSHLSIKLGSNGTSPAVIRVKAIDQETGAEIGSASTRLQPKEKAELSIQLFEVYARATIQLDFIGKANTEIDIESLLLQ